MGFGHRCSGNKINTGDGEGLYRNMIGGTAFASKFHLLLPSLFSQLKFLLLFPLTDSQKQFIHIPCTSYFLPLEWALLRSFDKPSENLLFLKICFAAKKMCETSPGPKCIWWQPYSFSPMLNTPWVWESYTWVHSNHSEFMLEDPLWLDEVRDRKEMPVGSSLSQLSPAHSSSSWLQARLSWTLVHHQTVETTFQKLLYQIPFVALLWQLHMPDFPDFPTSYDLFPCAHVLGELVSHFLWSNNSPF